jgi:hypothetical protein
MTPVTFRRDARESYARDSVKVAEELILEQKLMTPDELQQLREEIGGRSQRSGQHRAE